MKAYKKKLIKKIASNFPNIVKSFFIGKPSYQKGRLSICSTCEYNSKNRAPKTGAEEYYLKLNSSKPTCYACGCNLDRKTKIKEESCGLTEINQKPKWTKII